MTVKNIEGLKMQALRAVAKRFNINPFGKTKASLIREIQLAEGNFDCFGSAVSYCDQWGCRYRPLCFDEAKKWLPNAGAGKTSSRRKRSRK